jgi:hypothetical protein
LAFETQSAQVELVLLDPTEKLNASDRDRGVAEPLETEHRPEAQLDAVVILLDQIVCRAEFKSAHPQTR